MKIAIMQVLDGRFLTGGKWEATVSVGSIQKSECHLSNWFAVKPPFFCRTGA